MSARICGFMDDRFEKTFPRRYDRDLGNVRIVYLRSLSVDPWNINNYPMIKFLKFLIANYYGVSIILVLSYRRWRKDFSLTPFETSPSSSLHIFRVRSKRRKFRIFGSAWIKFSNRVVSRLYARNVLYANNPSSSIDAISIHDLVTRDTRYANTRSNESVFAIGHRYGDNTDQSCTLLVRIGLYF